MKLPLKLLLLWGRRSVGAKDKRKATSRTSRTIGFGYTLDSTLLIQFPLFLFTLLEAKFHRK
jgi:hypothetical protein